MSFSFLCLISFQQYRKNYIVKEEQLLKMGCDQSNEKNSEIVSLQTQQEFKLSFGELVTQDRGQIFDLYHFSTIISRSSFSTVRRIISRATNKVRVCKFKPFTSNQCFLLLSEVQFLKKLDHPNIIQIIQYFLHSSYLYIVLQEFPGNKILSELKTVKSDIFFDHIVQIMRQIICALDFCHRKNICHRAITPDNVMLFWKDNKPIIKIIDFSEAAFMDSPNISPAHKQKRQIQLGQTQYLYSNKLDVFDCGYLFYCILLGKKPERVSDVNQIFISCQNVIQKIGLPDLIKQDLSKLLHDMLQLQPVKRPEISQCLNYNFFQHFNKKINNKHALASLIDFKSDSNLFYLLSMYSSLNMTSSVDRAEYVIEFHNLDKNRDGQIQLEELIEGLMNTMNISEQKATQYAEQIFQNLDKNQSGSLNFSQFLVGTTKLSKLYTEQFLKSMFNEMDSNKDGIVSEKQLNNLISGIDKNWIKSSEKQINYKKFREIMLGLLKKKNEIQ